jgi:hypothetical protein
MAVMTSEAGSSAYLKDARSKDGNKQARGRRDSRQLHSHFFIVVHLSGTKDSRRLLSGSIIRDVAGAIISAQDNQRAPAKLHGEADAQGFEQLALQLLRHDDVG